jgi:hypothetical protein
MRDAVRRLADGRTPLVGILTAKQVINYFILTFIRWQPTDSNNDMIALITKGLKTNNSESPHGFIIAGKGGDFVNSQPELLLLIK